MSEFQFNAFQIKRQAHAVSRSDAGFNPFVHFWKKKDRRRTWHVEDQRRPSENDLDIVEAGSPIEHSQTASTGAHGAFGHDTDGTTTNNNREDLTGPDQEHTSGPEVALGSDFTSVDAGALEEPVESSDLGLADEPKKKKEHRLFKNVRPIEPFTVKNQIRRVFCGSWLSLLLFCVPVGISLGAVIGPSLETFFVNYAAVIPLYWLGDFAMTEIGLRTGALTSNYIGISTR